MFNNVVQSLLLEFGVAPLGRVPLARGPDINFAGPQVGGFLGSNVGNSIPLKIRMSKKKKKRKKEKKN